MGEIVKAKYSVAHPWADVCEKHMESGGWDYIFTCDKDTECIICKADRLGEELIIVNPLGRGLNEFNLCRN